MPGLTRREFVKGGIGVLGAAAVGCGSSAPNDGALEFPAGFLWGTATSAYQIEGGWDADGKGPSIWDTFVHRVPSPIHAGDTGDVACDHYRLFGQDVALMRGLNLGSYRFSISWSRVQPGGAGPANQAGIDFYSRLVDQLLAAGIRPMPTLFHYELPQAISDRGGWTSRDTAMRFADYATLMVKALGDRAATWLIFNEALWFTLDGYWTGDFAPGLAGDFPRYLKTTHVSNIAQGQAFQAMKAANAGLRISSAFDIHPVEPRSSSGEDQAAAPRLHALLNLWWNQPALRGQYPDAFRPFPAAEMDIRSGDMDLVRAPFDFLGINNYGRAIAGASSPGLWYLPGFDVGWFGSGTTSPRTDNGWEIWPTAIHDALVTMHNEYGLPIEVTENGCAYNDGPDASGVVSDQRRIAFYRDQIIEMHRAIQEGADVRAFHAWSLMDNFEWLSGFSQRFGLTYVDFTSPARTRTIKESGRWFAELARTNRLVS